MARPQSGRICCVAITGVVVVHLKNDGVVRHGEAGVLLRLEGVDGAVHVVEEYLVVLRRQLCSGSPAMDPANKDRVAGVHIGFGCQDLQGIPIQDDVCGAGGHDGRTAEVAVRIDFKVAFVEVLDGSAVNQVVHDRCGERSVE